MRDHEPHRWSCVVRSFIQRFHERYSTLDCIQPIRCDARFPHDTFLAFQHGVIQSVKTSHNIVRIFVLHVHSTTGFNRKSCASRKCCLAFRQGFQFLASEYHTGRSANGRYCVVDDTIRGAPITVISVVVVDIPCCVDIPYIVRIVTIARAQPHDDGDPISTYVP